jgi:hypothetical protein
VHPVRGQTWAHGATPLRLERLDATVEAMVCDGCGLTRFFTTPTTGHATATAACGECANTLHVAAGALVETASFGGFEQVRASELGGHFEAEVCAGCGRVRWFVYGLDEVLIERGRRCHRCGSAVGRTTLPVGEQVLRVTRNHQPLPIALGEGSLFFTRMGRFTLEICRGCGLTDWIAQDRQELRDGDGVRRVDETVVTGGPYR